MPKWEAGPGLNKLVAQHVFGFEIVPARAPDWAEHVRGGHGEEVLEMPVPDYSRDIDKAWLVVNEMRNKQSPRPLGRSSPATEFVAWWQGAPLYWRLAEEAALAICAAALVILDAALETAGEHGDGC